MKATKQLNETQEDVPRLDLPETFDLPKLEDYLPSLEAFDVTEESKYFMGLF